MKRTGILLWGLLLIWPTAYAQVEDSVYLLALPMVSQVNHGNSYITFPIDIGNIEPLWFEGNIIPDFYLRKSQNSRLMGVLTPQIILRMYREESFPVRTPSYIPQVTAYYRISTAGKVPSLTIFGRIAHHSNGQDGAFYHEDGTINVTSGNFATNFLELGMIAVHFDERLHAWQFFKSSIEIHPDALIQQELPGIYSQYRWHNAFSIFKLATRHEAYHTDRPGFSLKGEVMWMFGRFNHLESLSPDRLNYSLTFYYHPVFLEDIGLFVQYYHGFDYYNIYFNHKLEIVRFGIMTEKLRFNMKIDKE